MIVRRPATRVPHRWLALTGLCATLGVGSVIAAPPAPSVTDLQTAGTGAAGDAGDAGTQAADAGVVAGSDLAQAFALAATRVRDLVQERLAVEVDPLSLFDIDIGDPVAVDVERRRLDRLLNPSDQVDSGARAKQGKKSIGPKQKSNQSRRADAGSNPLDAGPTSTPEPVRVEAELTARLDLDRARLEFYRLPTAQRVELLEAHQAAQEKHAQTAQAQSDEAARRARAAEQEREQALEAARTARTEALRLVSEEHARLLSVVQKQAVFETQLVHAQARLARRKEDVLRWHRTVRETIDAASNGDAAQYPPDKVYTDLRRDLRAARDRLAEALSEVRAASSVPHPGEDRLSELPDDVDTSAPRATRRAAQREAVRLVAREHELRAETLLEVYDEVVSLNRDRLALYPSLSSARRGEIVGFGPAGFEQAKAEARQVVLVLRYHLQAAGQFLRSLRAPGGTRSKSALTATLVAFKWLLPIAVFILWRRRAEDALLGIAEAAREERQSQRVVEPSPVEKGIAFVMRVRKPIEWLALLAAIVWLLPAAVQETLEVALFSRVFTWTLGGAAAVATIDALASKNEAGMRKSRLLTSHVRLRSLKLVGRFVVAVGLILSLSERLVGRGTIYSWVLSTFAFAAIPITLILARWWHDIIHERLCQRNRNSVLDAWVVAHNHGWSKLPAALLGGALLLGRGTARELRRWLATFDLSRRVLAYLFRRDMSRRADTIRVEYGKLPADVFDALGPTASSRERVPSVADEDIQRVIDRINLPGGGIFAMVGERGSGKTTLLRRIQQEAKDVTLLDCPVGGVEALARALAEALGSTAEVPLTESAALADRPGGDPGVLIDNAHRLISPRMGGLDAFDELLAVVRRHSSTCSWVFAFDQVVWRFFERARGARPLFDEVIRLQPWREEAIGRLLVSRTNQVGIQPSFKHLLNDLPENADHVDVDEATERIALDYYRLLWDYAGGNPGIALHAWRLCLGIDPEGQVAVKIFGAPDARELEALPDGAVFVLRAVLQLEVAHPEEIARCTMLDQAVIEDALRFGLNYGYFELVGERYWLTWAWFRPVTRFLQRRYLLSAQ